MSGEERKFLHDISNPLTIAQGMTESVLDTLKGQSGIDEKVITRLEKAVKAMERMGGSIRARREILINREESDAESA